MKNLKINSLGFSLMELLVGMAIILTATTVVLAIIVSSFRLSSKTTSQDIVRQNGNYALSQMIKIIQFADAGYVTTPPNSCESPNPIPIQSLAVSYNNIPYIFSCDSNGLRKSENGGPFISMISNKVSLVPGSCEFSCSRSNSNVAPVINLKFKLQYGVGGGVVEKSAQQLFSTQVKMRNL